MKHLYNLFSMKTIFAFLILTSSLLSAPLWFVPQTLTQPDGTILNCFASGDEYYNWLHDKDGFTIIMDESGYYVYAELSNDELVPTSFIPGKDKPVSITPWLKIPAHKIAERKNRILKDTPVNYDLAPSLGLINNIVVFIRFSDEGEFTDQVSKYDNMFNDSIPNENSMYNYFKEASYGNVFIPSRYYPVPSGATVVSYQDTHPRNYYRLYSPQNPIGYDEGNRTQREHTLLKNAIDAISSQVPSNLNIDGDNDGYVDNVCFIIKGSPDGWAELLWPHMWVLYSQTALINGKEVWTYNFQLQTSLGSSGVGVLCHEMFHSLGSPDLYRYENTAIAPVGPWDVMENDLNPPQHMGAYMKYRYGNWINTIPEITSSGTYSLKPLGTSSTNNVYKIKSPKSSNEFFVVEYRKKEGTFEGSLPATGLLVYRINPSYNGNAQGPPDEVYIYRPGGWLDVNGAIGSAHFSANVERTEINPFTNPTAFLMNGAQGGLDISNVGYSDSVITFTVNILNSIMTMSPNGGEYFNIGETSSIKWENFGTATSSINIEYSTDNGINWSSIANSIPVSNYHYDWLVPNTPSYKCLIKISDAANGSLYDISNNTFHILPAANYNTALIGSFTTSSPCNDIELINNTVYLAEGENGIKIIDVSSYSNVIQKGSFNTAGNAKNLSVKDNLVFVADYENGLRILDVTNPASITEIGSYNKIGQLMDVIVRDNLAFAAYGLKGVHILDISNPSAPVKIKEIQGLAASISLHGNNLFIVNESNGTKIVDVSDPNNPVIVGNVNTAGHESRVKASNNYLYVAAKEEGLRVVDITNPGSPLETGFYGTPGNALEIFVNENYAYVADDDRGLRIIDISNVNEPIEVGFYETGSTNSVTVLDKFCFAAGNTGFQIIRNDYLSGADDNSLAFVSDYKLFQNYPNPFNPVTNIRFNLKSTSHIELKVYDIIGREIAVLVNEEKPSGNYNIKFNADGLSSGVYLYKIKAGDFVSSRKMIILK